MSPPFLSPFFFPKKSNISHTDTHPTQSQKLNRIYSTQTPEEVTKHACMSSWDPSVLSWYLWVSLRCTIFTNVILGFDLCLTSLQKLERRWVRRLASFLTKFFPVSSFTPHHLLITQTLAGTTWPYQVPFPLQTQVEALFGCTLNDNFLTGASPLSWSAACLKEKRCSLLRLVIMLLWLGRNTSTEWQLLHLNCSLSKFRRAACLS